MKGKKKITVLIIINNYLPGYKAGGPLSSIINLIDNLSAEYTFKVLSSDRDLGDIEPYKNISTNVWVQKENYEMCYVASGKRKFIDTIKLVNLAAADIVYAQSFFSPIFSIVIVIASKLSFIKAPKLIIAPRGEAFEDALQIKPFKKSVYLKLANIFNFLKNIRWHASTEMEKQAIVRNFKISEEKIFVALNLPKKRKGKRTICSNNNEENFLKIVFLSRISKIKNLGFTLDVLKELQVDVIYDIFGPIEDDMLWKDCLAKIKLLPPNVRVTYKGTVKKDQVEPTFAKYDLMFLPTFTENYGHAIVECLSTGTPVLISDNTPWRQLEQKGLGWDISLDKKEEYVRAIKTMSKLSIQEKANKRTEIVQKFEEILYDSETIEDTKKLFDFA